MKKFPLILAAAALLPLQIMQENDFYGILKCMDGLPVCIRLLDPPLHEFLPSLDIKYNHISS